MKIELHYPLIHYAINSWNLLRKWMTESLDESRKLHKGFIFLALGFVIFMDLFFGSDFAWYLFFRVSWKMFGPGHPGVTTCDVTISQES